MSKGNGKKSFPPGAVIVTQPEKCSETEPYHARFIQACIYNDTSILHKLLLCGDINLDSLDNLGRTGLMYACIHNYPNIVEQLLTAGVSTDILDPDGLTVIHLAVQHGSFQVLRLMLRGKVYPSILNSAGSTPLHYAILSKSLVSVAILLKDSIPSELNINYEDSNGMSPLALAVSLELEEYIHILLKSGAALEPFYETSKPILSYACGNTNTDIINLLLKQNIDIIHQMDNVGRTILHLAACEGSVMLAEVCLKQGLLANMCDSMGRAPLHWAMLSGQKDVALLLLGNLSRIDAEDDAGARAIHYAAQVNFVEGIQILILQGATINAVDLDGRDALFYSILHQSFDCCTILLENYADPNVADKRGFTPLHYAAQSTSAQACQLLLAAVNFCSGLSIFSSPHPPTPSHCLLLVLFFFPLISFLVVNKQKINFPVPQFFITY